MSDDGKHEIVIIRRGGHGDHDEHHGGVWKIAFADFMTAMMAFFLVMWLISANDKTRASVARYFNPVRLVDATTQPRGLHDTKKDESGITASPDGSKADDKKEKPGKESKEAGKEAGKEGDADKAGKAAANKETPAAREKRLDLALRENPFAALSEIAGKSAPQSAGSRGGDAFRDPFAPPPPPQPDDDIRLEPPSEDRPTRLASAKSADAGTPTGPGTAAKDSTGKNSTSKDGTGKGPLAKETAKAAREAETPPGATPAPAPAPPTTEARDEEVKALSAALPAQADGPQVEVRRTGEGVLVSLTDTAVFAMFANGSAVPARKLVLMMERVAQALTARGGTVVVRGFTDSKPYRAGRYDNWHLSLDRAQVTHYMLVRGGLSDARIGRVEGYADRQAKAGTEASNPVNRRIEILLKDAA